MRTVVVGDVHGCYNELKALFNELIENQMYKEKEDKVIFLGDYIDRGDDPRMVVRFIRSMQKDNSNVIALMGNHEDMLISYKEKMDYTWMYNGYRTTLLSYEGHGDEFASDIEWMKRLPLYYEDETYIYVHAGVNVDKELEEQDKDTMLWTREEFYNNDNKYVKPVIFGHTPTFFLSQGSDSKPVVTKNNNIGIDTGCVFGGALTALIIDDGTIEGIYQIFKTEEK